MKKNLWSLTLTLLILILASGLMVGLTSSIPIIEKIALAQNVPNNLLLNQPVEVAGVETHTPTPPKDQGIPAPALTAAGVLVEDLDSGAVIFAKAPDRKLPIASTTKIMTALIASEHFNAEEILTVPRTASVSGSTMGVKVGEKLSFRSLLYGMLLNSGNDAAFTIAEGYPGGVKAFVVKMNEKVRQLNLQNSSFDNPAGFDSPNHYSSAADLAKITVAALEDPQLTRIFATKETVVTSADRSEVHILKNLNKLLSLTGVRGVKTGFTPNAKENLVGLVERNNHQLLTVVLGSDDRFGETEKLIDWAYKNFSWD